MVMKPSPTMRQTPTTIPSSRAARTVCWPSVLGGSVVSLCAGVMVGGGNGVVQVGVVVVEVGVDVAGAAGVAHARRVRVALVRAHGG